MLTPPSPNSFIFMQFSAKKLQTDRIVHPLWELHPLIRKSLDPLLDWIKLHIIEKKLDQQGAYVPSVPLDRPKICIFSGIPAHLILFSVTSSSAADENRMEEARSYGRASCWVSVFGAIIGVVVIVILIVMYVTVWNNVNSIYGNNPYSP